MPGLNQDIAFSVPLVHRLRTTDDVLGRDFPVLLDLLERSGSDPARVQVWVDDAVAASQPGLVGSLTERLAAYGDRVQLTEPPQLVPGGEPSKNDPAQVDRLLEHFNRHDLDRRSYVVVIGGGAVLDTVGFAASIAHRGIRLVRLPTTTLAQADSGVGVKNAVNWFGKKNWKGTFAVPWAVINDSRLLDSLSDRDFRSGFSEAVKVALLKNPATFEWLCEHAERIRNRDMAIALRAIAASVDLHVRHITEGGDPFEMLEARPLDFGHWSAHRLESLANYRIRHGEAVGIGVAIDCLYSSRVHGLPRGDAERTIECLEALGLPTYAPELDSPEPLFRGLEEFRQHLGGRLTLTMLRGVGEPVNVHDVDRPSMRWAIAELGRREQQRTAGPPAEAARSDSAGS